MHPHPPSGGAGHHDEGTGTPGRRRQFLGSTVDFAQIRVGIVAPDDDGRVGGPQATYLTTAP
ncbi:hypothetical protein [Streptomyces vastus]|uniref:Uncharacterized protein n=1 Tax=Streptomyces vastus TaxID=285451 RepID=A0ABP6CZL5_9ACTN